MKLTPEQVEDIGLDITFGADMDRDVAIRDLCSDWWEMRRTLKIKTWWVEGLWWWGVFGWTGFVTCFGKLKGWW